MPKPRPKPQARGLAAGLRALRKEAKLPMQWVADQLGWSQPTISRIEAGKRIVTPEEVSALLATYRVTGEERDRLIDMARDTDRNGWLETGPAGIPAQTMMLAQYETEATRLVSVDLMLIPGLLQTRAYTSAVMRAVGTAPAGIEPRVSLRQRRQRILDAAAPPHLTMILDEAALRRPQGGPRVMAEQLEHLLVMAQRPNIELRMIPFDHGGHAAVGGAYMLLEFATANPVVHVESSGAGIFLDEPEDVAIYLDTTASLRSVALEHEPSVRFIAAVAAEYPEGVTTMDTTHATWRKSSYSAGEGNCVEVAALPENRIAVRNSNHPGDGVVSLTRPELAAWIKGVQAGEFDDLA